MSKSLVAYVFASLFGLTLNGVAFVFLVVLVVLSLTGSSFGGIWNSGLWKTTPVRRLSGAVADVAVITATALASWWLVVDVIGVPGLLTAKGNCCSAARSIPPAGSLGAPMTGTSSP